MILLVSSSAGLRGCPGADLLPGRQRRLLPVAPRALARDHADENIRVNVVAPGVIRTRFHAQMTAATPAQSAGSHSAASRGYVGPSGFADCGTREQ